MHIANEDLLRVTALITVVVLAFVAIEDIVILTLLATHLIAQSAYLHLSVLWSYALIIGCLWRHRLFTEVTEVPIVSDEIAVFLLRDLH